MSFDDELKTKYEFILRPIKDLTKNWEVDVSQILEKYMCDIEKLSFTVNNGDAVINFAEASLLIQGTACVWSRKVEYLHMLIKKSLDMIVNKQSAPGQILLEPGNSSTIDDGQYDDEGCQLLRLDDVSITSQRLMTGKRDVVSPIPLPPSSMLEANADERGRVIITEDKTDALCYSNDFWENHYIPFSDKYSVLDRDSKGARHKTVLAWNNHSETAPLMEQLPESNHEPNSYDTSQEGFDEEPLPVNESLQEDMEEMVSHRQEVVGMQLRPKVTRNVDLSSGVSAPGMLDPYEDCTVSTWTNKRYIKSKSAKLPPSLLMKSTKRKHDGSSTLDRKHIEPINDFMNRHIERHGSQDCENSSLSIIMKLVQKNRSMMWKSIKHQASKVQQSDDIEVDENEIEHEDECPDNSSFSPNPDCMFGIEETHTTEETQPEGTYEDLVRNVVEKYYFCAQRYKEQTALAQRVKQWDEVVTPCLEEQSQRPVFDIHTYGDIILKKFSQAKETRLFEDVVDSVDAWNICRLFAATLQLANDNNFSISKSDDFEKSINTMTLSLLSQHRLHNRFDNYSTQS